MARETQGPRSSRSPPSGSPFGLPGLGRGKAIDFYGDPAKGAELEAPTAPHATTANEKPKKLSGPARFWRGRMVRVVFAITLMFSLGAHWWVAPWNLLPSDSGINFKDNNDPLSIPVDLIADEPPPPPPPPEPAPPPPPTENTANPPNPNAPGGKDAGTPPKDAGQPLTDLDAGIALNAEGGAPTDAGEGITDASTTSTDDSGAIALASDAGPGAPGSNGPRDPESMFGLSKAVNTGIQNVVLGLNVALVRKHPVGSRMGPILQQIPQWKDFVKGATTPVDPIRDTDWILIYGPSLIHTERDAVLVRYTASDDLVDQTITSIAKTYDKGGPFDAGVPGVKASLGFADHAPRVFLRPQSKLLVIVPPSHAKEAALAFKTQKPRGPAATEAMRLIVRNPTNQVSIRGLKFSESLTEIRLWIIPRADGGADVYAEGDCTDEAAATDSADRLTELLKQQNSLGVKFATRGLLNKAVVVADGKRIKLHIDASPEQLEAVLQIVAAAMNANIAPPTNAPPPPGPAPAPTKSHME